MQDWPGPSRRPSLSFLRASTPAGPCPCLLSLISLPGTCICTAQIAAIIQGLSPSGLQLTTPYGCPLRGAPSDTAVQLHNHCAGTAPRRQAPHRVTQSPLHPSSARDTTPTTLASGARPSSKGREGGAARTAGRKRNAQQRAGPETSRGGDCAGAKLRGGWKPGPASRPAPAAGRRPFRNATPLPRHPDPRSAGSGSSPNGPVMVH